MLAVDGAGRVHDGDELIALAARGLAARGELGGGVVVTVMTNFGFHQAMEEAGIEVAMTQVGDRYVIDEMRRRDWTLGGEQSGHIIASDFVATGDGIAAALMTMRELGGAGLADAAPMRKLPQTLVNVKVADREAIAGAAAVWEAVERESEAPRGPRPGAPAPLRDRAAGPGDGRGAERRGGRRGLRAAGRPGAPRARLSRPDRLPPLPFSPSCAASSDTWARGPARSCSSPVSKSSNTAAMTRPGSPCSRTARSRASTRSATSPTCAPRSRRAPTTAPGRCRPPTTGIAHTRWATHGRVTEENAHPHDDSSGQVHIVLNGIVENHAELRRRLQEEGQSFTSETDAEVVAHLIAHHYDGDLAAAVRAAYAELRGHYAFVAMHADEPQRLLGARKECPLVAGVGEGETFLASAIPAFLADTRTAMPIENGEIVEIEADEVRITDARRQPDRARAEEVDLGRRRRREGRLRDLHAEGDPRTGRRGRRDDHRPPARRRRGRPLRRRALRRVPARRRRIVIVACGTSYHAGLVGRYAIEEWARVPVEMDIASEYRYRNPVVGPDDLVIGITQSGETADTLAAMRLAREAGAKVLAVTNIMGSQATRDADAVLYTRAGLEIGVAATKTFVAQVAAMYLLGLRLAELRGTLPPERMTELVAELKALPSKIEETLAATEGIVSEIAARHSEQEFFLYLGRHIGLPVCLEGALKLKEISYIPTDAYAAGEMKHGPIALLDESTPVVCVATDSPILEKVLSNVEEVRARGAQTIAIATAGDGRVAEVAEETIEVAASDWILQPILAILPLQLLAYDIARNARPQRRPAAQPGEDGHGRVSRPKRSLECPPP